MNWSRALLTIAAAVCGAMPGAVIASAEGPSVPPVTRVEVVLANQYKNQTPELTTEFAKAGLTNVHFQFVKRGRPPQNIGLGKDVPADKARDVFRLALKYNMGVAILLPERLFPPRFVTIASSNFDDTVEYPIDENTLAKLQDPNLTTAEFHQLYHQLTWPPKDFQRRY